MKYLIRLKESRTLRPLWLATVAAVLVSLAAGAVAEPGAAAPAGANAYYPPQQSTIKRPTLAYGALRIKGTERSDKIALRLQAGVPDTLQIDVGDDGSPEFTFKRSKIAKIAVDARAGNDIVRIDESNGAFTDTIPTTLDGGNGRDTIAGGKGVETLRGGSGNDSLDGNGGNDLGVLGAGNDTFIWDPGDGSDVVEGQAGVDTMRFNGANAAERVELSANGRRLKFFREPGAITMDTAGVERVDFNALGGADLGGATGDGQADRVVVNATNGNDRINVNGDAGGIKVSGLAATVALSHSEAANDRLEISTLAGTDTVESGGLAAGAIQLFVDSMLVR
jgi:Ca2+-binding RTX toxin-like protein